MLVAVGCSDSGSGGGTGGSGGGTGGGAGGSGGGTGGAGGSGGSFSGGMFMPISPCNGESMYMEATTVMFPGSGAQYLPNCVKVHRGASVTFSGTDFVIHPLTPGTRGTSPNPIPMTSTGTMVTVTFPDLGFFPFYCKTHGTDSGNLMSGVAWVD
jgi:plastocyanin